jgi:hypothetical protein
MKETFVSYKPQAATLRVIEQANAIISEYEDQGFVLTLRQLFYQFVARALLQNLFKEYKRLGNIVRRGLIDWDAIEDRTRVVHTHTFWIVLPVGSAAFGIRRTYGLINSIGPKSGSRRTP